MKQKQNKQQSVAASTAPMSKVQATKTSAPATGVKALPDKKTPFGRKKTDNTVLPGDSTQYSPVQSMLTSFASNASAKPKFGD